LDDVTLVYLVQHGEKAPLPGDPGLTRKGQEQARLTGQRLRGLGISALYSSPMRRARETAEGIASATGLTVWNHGGVTSPWSEPRQRHIAVVRPQGRRRWSD
jgi:broad specificity phosphatase PhoE